jgi:hypothetical protein
MIMVVTLVILNSIYNLMAYQNDNAKVAWMAKNTENNQISTVVQIL